MGKTKEKMKPMASSYYNLFGIFMRIEDAINNSDDDATFRRSYLVWLLTGEHQDA